MDSLDKLSEMIINRDHRYANELFTSETSSGLSVYQNNYLMALISTLSSKFEVTEKFLGKDNFRFFAHQYIKNYDSKSSNIDNYGMFLPEFLESREELEEVSYVGLLARLDLFWFFNYENRQKYLELPLGVLEMWGYLKNDEELDNISIDENILERIEFVEKEGSFSLIGKKNV